MNLNDKYKTLFNSYHVNTPLRIAHFMCQLEHESGLKPISENLNYSAKRLLEVFPKYFKTTGIAIEYGNQKEKIANRVYANRIGNGDEASGDGYKFRGRGFLQITGKDNYLMLSKDARIDCFDTPDILLEEANAMISALWFFSKNNLFKYADADDIISITKKINGGLNGIEDRILLLKKYKTIFKCQ